VQEVAQPATQQPAPAAERASGSSFYLGMRILPRAQREAMFEIYSFCRAVDDIADDPGPRQPRLDALEQWRSDIAALYAGSAPPHLAGLAQAVRNFALDRGDFLAVIAGMEMDVIDDIRAPDHVTLDLYCDRVACAVGRLSVHVFGMERDAGLALAHHLGRALQLTNILRDLDEDASLGRLYLPREALQAAGITSTDPAAVVGDPAIGKPCGALVALAQDEFEKARAVMAESPRRVVRAPRIMGEAYRLILDQLIARGFEPPRQPVHLPRGKFLFIVLRNLF
jgi:phytoene synthase